MGLSVISSLPNGISPAASAQINGLAEGLPGEFAALLSGGLLPAGQLGTTRTSSNLTQLTSDITKREKDLKLSAEDIPAETINLLDPSMLTALTGKPLVAADITARETIGLRVKIDQQDGAMADNAETPVAENSILSPDMPTRHSIELQAAMSQLDGQAANVPALQPEIVARGGAERPVGTEGNEKRIPGLLNPSGTNPDRNEGRVAPRTQKDDLGAFEKLLPGGLRNAPSGTLGNETAKFAGEIKALETTSPTQTANTLTNSLARPSQATPSADQTNIHSHLRENTWTQEFGEKVVWLAKNDQQSARININPPELGPVQITLSLNGDQAKIAFSSPHPEVRQAIESAMPQLKEMLSSAGINLGQSNVGANLSQQNPDNPYQTANPKHLADENAILPANDKALNTSSGSVLLRGRGMVDLFA